MSARGKEGADNAGEWQGSDRTDWIAIKEVVNVVTQRSARPLSLGLLNVDSTTHTFRTHTAILENGTR